MFWLATLAMLLWPMPPIPTLAMFRRSDGGVWPGPSTCRGTIAIAAPLISAFSMKSRREMLVFFSSSTPHSHAEVMIYLPRMTQILILLVSAVLAVPAAQGAGPWKSLFDGKSLAAWRIFRSD